MSEHHNHTILAHFHRAGKSSSVPEDRERAAEVYVQSMYKRLADRGISQPDVQISYHVESDGHINIGVNALSNQAHVVAAEIFPASGPSHSKRSLHHPVGRVTVLINPLPVINHDADTVVKPFPGKQAPAPVTPAARPAAAPAIAAAPL